MISTRAMDLTSGLLVSGLCLALLSCGGEITVLTLGNDKQASFERYRDEVQPVFQALTGPNDLAQGVARRSCAEVFCHGSDNGVGSEGGPPLRIVKDPNDAELVENFRQAVSRIDLNNPESSLLITDPVGDTAHVGGLNFINKDDCCYKIVLAWIQDVDGPLCDCPPQ